MNLRVCIVIINVMWLFLTVPWVGLQYVIVVFPFHTHLFLVLIIPKLSLNWIILLQLYDQTVRYESIIRPCSISSPKLTSCKTYVA